MRISEDLLTEALEYVLNETDITELAEIIYGEDPTVEQIVDFARVVVESVILECLVENYKEWLMKTHCKLGGIKTKYGKEQSLIERKVVEDEYDTWEKKFLKVFEGCFSKNQELLDEIRIKFENYKFNKKNAVNDNSILFFTFSLYDIASAKCEKKSQLARKYAKAAYKALKKTSNNHALYIDEKKLITFTEELIGENYKQVFIKVFLKFIQSLYGSEKLHDIERYLFFERFQGFIIATNLSIKVASRLLPEDCIVIREDSDINGESSKKIYKSIYYEKNKLIEKKDKEFIETIEKLQHAIATFPKNVESMDKKTVKERIKINEKALNDIEKFVKHNNSKYANAVSKIIEKYKNVVFEDMGISVIEQMLIEPIVLACGLAYKGLSSVGFYGNVYLRFILYNSTQKLSDEDYSQLNELKDNVEISVKNYIKEKFILEVDSVNRNLYENIIEYVDLEKFDFPILKISSESWLIICLARLL